MKHITAITLAVAAACTSLAAHADVYDLKFSGTVQAQTGTGLALNSPISGEFFYDSVAGTFLSFVVGSQSAATGFTSIASMTPDKYTALFSAQVTPVPLGGPNTTLSVDLEGSVPWSVPNAVSLLATPALLASNLDTSLSSFGWYTANADGSNVQSVTASITSLQVSAVPEPTSAALLAAGTLLLGLRLRGAARSRG